MRFLFKLVFYPLVLLALLAGAGMFFLDAAVETGIETVGTQVARVEVTIDGVGLSLFSGKGAIRGLQIANPKGYRAPRAVKVERVLVALKPLSVFSERVVIHSVVVQAPEIHYEKRGGKTNLDVIQANVEAAIPADTGAKTGPGRKLQIDNLVVRDAKLYWYGDAPDAEPTLLILKEIHLKDLGTGPEGITGAELARRLTAAITRDAAAAVLRGLAERIKEGLFGR